MAPLESGAKFINKFKSLITRIKFIEEFVITMTIENQPTNSEINTRINSIENLYKEYETLLEKTLGTEITDEVGTEIDGHVKTIESMYHNILSKLYAGRITDPIPSLSNQKRETIKLPEVNIPIFDGKSTEWIMFKETFTAVIQSNEKLSNVIKFTYLLDKLRGDAKATIGHISLSDAGYTRAWKDLIARYDDKRHIIATHVDGILNLPYASKENSVELRTLLNLCNSHVSSLESLDQALTGLSQVFIITAVSKKIDIGLRKDWETELQQNLLPSWEKLQSFLAKKCRILEAVETTTKSHAKPIKINNNKNSNKPLRANTFATSSESNSLPVHRDTKVSNNCAVCKQAFHALFFCTIFKKLSVEDRFRRVKDLKLCINCFSSKHTSKDCQRGNCKHCQKKHNTLLHRNDKKSFSPPGNKVSNEASNTTLLSQYTKKKSLFPTAMILVQDRSGDWINCRALLDSASDANLISNEFLNTCSVPISVMKNTTITSLNNQKTVSVNTVNVNIKSKYIDYERNINCSVVPTIVKSLPEIDINISKWFLPHNIKLADPQFNMTQSVDILLGNELFFEIIQPKQIQVNRTAPLLQKSVFGYLVVGPYNNINLNFTNFANIAESTDSELNRNLKQFWELESYPEKHFLSENEKFCETHFSETHTRDQEGRYIVSMPLTENSKRLGDSKTQALRRFYSLENRLNADPDLKEQYFKFINEYISLNHMMKISESKDSVGNNFYLPHHGVLKLSSSTTKLRVVFDASAKTSSNLSLNEVMLIGPTIQEDLFSIILRFRKHPFVFTADISKMYRQVQIHPSQTRLLRILWRFNQTSPIETYELQTVTYGTASAPYLATKALKQLTEDEQENYPIASKIAQTDFYVDDILSGENSVEKCLEIQQQLIRLLAAGGFQLHKWCSNTKELLDNIPIKDREVLQKNETSSHESIKALGLLWKPKQDLFCFDIHSVNTNASPTKRSILSEIAKMYDPLGLLGPIIITAKILIQILWKNNYDWDQKLPTEIASIWISFSEQLPHIKNIHIERCILTQNATRLELHGFADASEKAYGACIYLKYYKDTQQVCINLVCSKTRVAPLKVVSLPRLELCAALLLSKLMQSVVQSLKLSFDNITLWSDSQIVLQWINIEPYKLKTFVANRVSEIQELTTDFKWEYIESSNNAADIISRGIYPRELEDISDWWKGPSFLYSHESNTNPKDSSPSTHLNIDVSLLELKPTTDSCLSLINQEFDLFERFSSLDKLIRITALCIRFCNNLKNKSSQAKNELSVLEINNSLLVLVRLVQKIEFHSELNQLRLNKSITINSKIKNLNPFIDEQNLLRVGGRLSNSDYDYDIKHQLLLPYKHTLTKLIVRQEHEKNMHAGPQLLVSLIRQRFWPIKLKILAKQIVRNCVTCFKIRPKLSHQLMGNLPSERTKPEKPFNTTGVDLCGPFHLKIKYNRKGTTYKVYVASFICFVTKAVHLEIVSDLSSDAFLACLKRFLYRRGKCNTIWSDNATNFVGCNNEFKKKKLFLSEAHIDQKITSYCTMNQITWKFIPPNAPNFGGLWESSVKSLKFHLKRVANDMIFYYEEFNTLIIQIEGIMNSRPLYAMSTDPSEPEPLTPAHFLTGGAIVAPPEKSYDKIAENRLNSWKRLEKLTQSFWKRFSIEYIHTLQQRQKWKDSVPDIKLNDIVIIANDSLQPTDWLLGRIVNPIIGPDGHYRVFDIQTQNGILRRPISKLCRLPIDN